MAPPQSADDPAQRQLFDTIKSTYPLASEAELRAMVQEVKHHLPTISAGEREALIDSIENAIGQNLEDDREFDL